MPRFSFPAFCAPHSLSGTFNLFLSFSFGYFLPFNIMMLYCQISSWLLTLSPTHTQASVGPSPPPALNVGIPQGSVMADRHDPHSRNLSSQPRPSVIVTGVDMPRLFPGPDFILNFRPSCSASRFTFPTSCLKSSLHKTYLKANAWLSLHQVGKLEAVLIGSPAFSPDQILFNTTFC